MIEMEIDLSKEKIRRQINLFFQFPYHFPFPKSFFNGSNKEKGAMEYTIVVAEMADSPCYSITIPHSLYVKGAALAEYFYVP